MATITSISTQKRAGRYNVYLDGKFSFAVDERTLIRFGLSKGMELDQSRIDEIQTDDAHAKALGQALNYISHQARTEQQVDRFLMGKDYDEQTSASVIAELIDLHYLDDAEYARRFVAESINKGDRGPRGVRQWLNQRGVSNDDIEEALRDYDQDQAITVATQIAEKAFAHPGSKSAHAQTQAVHQKLMQKGFDSEVISIVLADVQPEEDEEREDTLLREAAEKAWRQKRGVDPFKRGQKVKQQLYRKGFDLDAIDRVLDEIKGAES